MCLSVASAATWMGLNPKKPKGFEHKEGCFVAEIKDVIPFGKTITPIGYCYRITCGEKMMDYASCGVVGAGENCYVTETDLTKPYPECCPSVKCEEHNRIVDED